MQTEIKTVRVRQCWFWSYVSTSSTCLNKADIYLNDWYPTEESAFSFIRNIKSTGWGQTGSYSNWEGLSTTDSGSNRKCFWVILPVRVSIVTTGKPIWRVQRFIMSWTLWGIFKPGVLSTAWKQAESIIRRNTCTPTLPTGIRFVSRFVAVVC